jgi:tetratricopeptide (TPR) repeat protein
LTGYSYGVTDQRLAVTSIELNKTEVAKNALTEKEIFIQQRYEEQANVVRKAQQEFNQALDEIPTGFDAIKQEVLGAAIDTYKLAVSAKSCSNGLVKSCLAEPIGSTAKNMNKAALEKANLAMEALKLAEEQYRTTFVELMAHYDNMTQMIVQLASLDMTKIDYEQIIPILQQAIKYLSEIRVHWGKLIEFFDNLRIRVQVERALSDLSLHHFVLFI